MNGSKLTIVERLKADLRAAMKARENVRVTTLRTMLSALDNATAVEADIRIVPLEGRTPDVPRRELSEEEQLDLLQREAEGRRSALAQYERLEKEEVVARLRAELDVFAPYLKT
jgi:uncharacterized protein YqeY